MLVIGLTGGMGSGKSTVADCFASLGCEVINMDQISRELSSPGQDVYAQIIKTFGTGILAKDRSIDRSKLAQIVFNDPQQRRQLEGLLHPAICAQVRLQLAKLDCDICIVEIPLLNSRSQFDFIDRILVINSDQSQQRQRINKRDGLSFEQIEARMTAQIKPEHRLALADDIITNNDTLQALRQQVQTLHKEYVKLAKLKKSN